MRNFLILVAALFLSSMGSIVAQPAQGSKWTNINAQIKRTQQNDFADRRTIAFQLLNLAKQDPHSVYKDGVIGAFEEKFKTTLENMELEEDLIEAISNAHNLVNQIQKTPAQELKDLATFASWVYTQLLIAYETYNKLSQKDSNLLNQAVNLLEELKKHTLTSNPVKEALITGREALQNQSYWDYFKSLVSGSYMSPVVVSGIIGLASMIAYYALMHGIRQATPEAQLNRTPSVQDLPTPDFGDFLPEPAQQFVEAIQENIPASAAQVLREYVPVYVTQTRDVTKKSPIGKREMEFIAGSIGLGTRGSPRK